MTTETQATAREQIRALLYDRAAAITARDAQRAVAHYAPKSSASAWPRRCATPGLRLATRRASRAGSAPGAARSATTSASRSSRRETTSPSAMASPT